MKGNPFLIGVAGSIRVPRNPQKAGLPQLPTANPIVMDSGHHPHALGFGLKTRMPEETADKKSALLCGEVEVNQRVAAVAQMRPEKMQIAREKRGLPQTMQERNDVVVANAGFPKVQTDRPPRYAGKLKRVPLFQRNIRVQNVYAGSCASVARACDASFRSGVSGDLRASWTASAMASLLKRPPPQR
jgi:hypothetical protein